MSAELLRVIAENTQFTEVELPAGGLTALPLALPNPLRYAIGFSTSFSAVWQISTDPQVSATGGISLSGAGFISFSVKDWGCLPQQAWFVAPNIGAGTIVVWEMFFLR